jgi:exopolysaccharide biosynthesis protein
VDGHEPGHSVGLSFPEEAALMRALGATQAVNLDGGGSTTLVSGDQVVNVPSDPTGERAIGDAVLLFGAGRRTHR